MHSSYEICCEHSKSHPAEEMWKRTLSNTYLSTLLLYGQLALFRLFFCLNFLLLLIESLKTKYLRSKWKAGTGSQGQQPDYHTSTESPPERSAHGPVICGPIEETNTETSIGSEL